MKKSFIVFIFIILVLGIIALLPSGNKNSVQATMYKSPDCGCCVGHARMMESKNFDVNIKYSDNLEKIKEQFNIPPEMWSCHTEIIDGYFIEGHMPYEAIKKLLDEKPNIDGIALPGMPSGSPGMPGTKSGIWIIYSIKDGKVSKFMEI